VNDGIIHLLILPLQAVGWKVCPTAVKSIKEFIMTVSYGDGRLVLIFKNFVIKIPKNIRGIAQSMAEIMLWKKYHHRLLCPILGNIWFIIIMRRAEFRKIPVSTLEKHFLKIQKDIKELRYRKSYHGDFRYDNNWGKIDNRYVMVDYGLTRDVARNYEYNDYPTAV